MKMLSAVMLGAGLLMSVNAFATGGTGANDELCKACSKPAMVEECNKQTKNGTIAPTGMCAKCEPCAPKPAPAAPGVTE